MIDLKEGPYKGFLLIKCDGCGKLYGFHAKQVTYSAICNECGEVTLLEKMRPVHLECDNCGHYYSYLTNIRTREFTYRCNNCESPVDMELNLKKMRYHTLGHDPVVKKIKRRSKQWSI
ncbi:MAG: hypothetical protein Q4B86_07320 [Eubacteriales bacterium]|nr:hypothetical protein [Eubacteriales bacterium]